MKICVQVNKLYKIDNVSTLSRQVSVISKEYEKVHHYSLWTKVFHEIQAQGTSFIFIWPRAIQVFFISLTENSSYIADLWDRENEAQREREK